MSEFTFKETISRFDGKFRERVLKKNTLEFIGVFSWL